MGLRVFLAEYEAGFELIGILPRLREATIGTIRLIWNIR